MTYDVHSGFAAALSLQQAGHAEAAKAEYRRVLDADPRHIGALTNLTSVLIAENTLDEALACCERTLAITPDDPQAQRNAGLIHAKRGDTDLARKLLTEAISRNAGDAEAAFYLGTSAQSDGDNEAAVRYYRQAIATAPDVAEVHSNLGTALLSLKRPAEAIESLTRAIELRSDFAAAWNSLGNAYEAERNYEPALAAYDRALSHDPKLAAARLNRAQLRIEFGDLQRAASEVQNYLDDYPDDPAALNALGLLHQRAARHSEAIAAFRRAIDLRSNYLQAINNLAISLMATGLHEDAVELYEVAANLAPDVADTHVNLGHIYQTLGRHQEAAVAFRQALASDPSFDSALPFLVHALMYQCDWRDLDAVIERMLGSLERKRTAGETVSAPPFGIAGTPASPSLRLAVARAMSNEIERTMQGQTTATRPHSPSTSSNRKLRIGYVSPDFREHSLGMVFHGLLAAHSRDDFAWHGYSVSPRPDLSFTSYQRDFDGFVDLGPLSYAQSIDRIRDDNIDILIDLAGHTRDSGLELFALRPAPVQIHYLGYGATLGANFIDYLVTDPVHTPPELAPFCSESLIFLPDSFMAATPAEISARPFTRADCGLPDDAVVLANFNAHYKINPEIFSVWMRLLERIPRSVLWLREGAKIAQENLRREAKARGVDPKRLVFAGRLERSDHLARHHLADLALDTHYHVGGVTTIDALWTGVPVVTIAGPSHSMRTGASILSAIGLPQLITETIAAYETLVYELATNSEQRAALRADLEHKRLNQPLFDPQRLARHLEAAYRMIWQHYQTGKSPIDIGIDPLPN